MQGMKNYDDNPGSRPEMTVNAPEDPVLLSVSDVCGALQCGRTFVYELLRKGELRRMKLGRLTRFSRAALGEFIARSEEGAIEAAIGERNARSASSARRLAPVRLHPRPTDAAPSRTPDLDVDRRYVQQCLPDGIGSLSTLEARTRLRRLT